MEATLVIEVVVQSGGEILSDRIHLAHRCPECGEHVSEAWRYCPNCGAERSSK